ncbi:hypothetical protein [Bosea sp. BK604]|uniref:hypothetical protein n=1 Tax=Bosea sp. BK604 TaxID=2512180 RepID=UPI00104B1125|nr:hypothetical protein [Bosea sp. BK604]TCR64680.1 hypothetical protein EV560_106146 [Bosea sp. BK604]
MEPTQAKADQSRTILRLPRVQQFIELIVAGEKFDDAAKTAGLRLKRARMIMSDPAIRRHYFRQMEVVSESERARNIRLRRTLRDRGMEADAPAALAKVALEAARQLDGDDRQASITINGSNNVIAGYVVRLPPPGEGPRAITNRSAESDKPLINHEDVTDVEG